MEKKKGGGGKKKERERDRDQQEAKADITPKEPMSKSSSAWCQLG